jgi:Xaa-Pro aminopeptidase
MNYHLSVDLSIRNRNKLINLLDNQSVAIVLSNDHPLRSGDQNFRYRQNSDLLYLTGINQQETILVLCPGHPEDKKKEMLFILKPDKTIERWEGHKLTREETREISGIKNIYWLEELELLMRDAILHSDKIYISTNEYLKLVEKVADKSMRFINEIKEKYPLHDYRRLSPFVTGLRVIKEPEEIEMISKACRVTGDAFNRILKFLHAGVYEYEVEAEITHEFLRQGTSGHAYLPIIASGNNANALHYTENSQQCRDGDLLLMDFGAEYANYIADCTRTIPVNGKFTRRQKELYKACLNVLNRAMELVFPGNTITNLHNEICKAWEEEHIRLGLYTMDQLKNQDPEQPLFFKYYMHGTSHFIGLDVHDVGQKEIKFSPGMIMTCEPGIYLDEEGIGIRLENNILCTENGPVNLMNNIPVDPDEIEMLMKKNK